MRYSIAFLGLIAFATSTPVDPCQAGIQPLLVPLAQDPAAAKFCASTDAAKSGTDSKSDNPYDISVHLEVEIVRLTRDEQTV
jgi:hypothetical protein